MYKRQEVVIFIGLIEWSEEESNLKPKRGKRLALEKAFEKWKTYNSNLYEGEDYVLFLDNGQEALFLPRPGKEFFSLHHYQEEVGKDFKPITLYLCTATSLREFHRSQTVGLDWATPDIEDEDYSTDKQGGGASPKRLKMDLFPKSEDNKKV